MRRRRHGSIAAAALAFATPFVGAQSAPPIKTTTVSAASDKSEETIFLSPSPSSRTTRAIRPSTRWPARASTRSSRTSVPPSRSSPSSSWKTPPFSISTTSSATRPAPRARMISRSSPPTAPVASVTTSRATPPAPTVSAASAPPARAAAASTTRGVISPVTAAYPLISTTSVPSKFPVGPTPRSSASAQALAP